MEKGNLQDPHEDAACGEIDLQERTKLNAEIRRACAAEKLAQKEARELKEANTALVTRNRKLERIFRLVQKKVAFMQTHSANATEQIQNVQNAAGNLTREMSLILPSVEEVEE